MTDSPRTISPADLAAALSGAQPPLVIDVLASSSWVAHRLAGAHNACVYEVAFGGKVAELAPDHATPLVVYGAGGDTQEAAAAAAKLAAAGYTDVHILEGGLDAWCAASLSIEGTAAAPLPSPGPPALVDGSWRLDTEASWLRWVGRNPNGFHDGSVDITAGSVAIKGGDVEGRFSVDPKTLRNFDLEGSEHQQGLIGHLLSEDFIFADRFPDVTFELGLVAPINGAVPTSATHRIEGTLELRGVRAPLDFETTVSTIKDGALAVEAHFDLDRTDWGLIYGSARFFAHLGMHVVYDDVSIALRLVLKPV